MSCLKSVHQFLIVISILLVSPAYTLTVSVPASNSEITPELESECVTRKGTAGRCLPIGECYGIFKSSVQITPRTAAAESVVSNEETNPDEFVINENLFEDILNTSFSLTCSSSPIAYDNNNNINGHTKICCPNENILALAHGNSKDSSTFFSSEETQFTKSMAKIKSGLSSQSAACGTQKVSLKSERIVYQQSTATTKITGGKIASRGEFPWMVAIFGVNGKQTCGGSLINNDYILTASHCLASYNTQDIAGLRVTLADHHLHSTADGQHETRGISKIILHNGFSLKHFSDDIALMKLDRPVQFTDYIQPICLPPAITAASGPTSNSSNSNIVRDNWSALEGRKVIVMGWGRERTHGSLSPVLRKVEIPIWNQAECQRIYKIFAPGMKVLDSHICAGDGKKNKDACVGDSGGPIVFRTGSKFYQLGIVSWGKGCGSFPGVYTRIDKYLHWIMKNIQ